MTISGAIACGMAMITWFNPLSAPSLYDGARFLELAILGWVSLVFIAIGDLRQGVLVLAASLPRWIRLSLVSMAFLAGASALQSRFPASALLDVGLNLLLLHFACACAILAHQGKHATDLIFVSALLVGALIFEIFFLLYYNAALNSGVAFSWVKPFVTFSNVRFFSQVQAYTLPLMLMPLLAFEIPKTLRAGILAITAIWWALHFASGTRSVWVALIVSTLGMLLWLRQKALPWLLLQGETFLMGGVIYAAFAWGHDQFSMSETYGIGGILSRGTSDSGRFELWSAAWEMIRSSPWLGVGPMHFGFYNFKVAAHPHNSWLQMAAEYGLPMALLLTVLVAGFLGLAFRWCQNAASIQDRSVNICLTASLLGGFADGMFSGNTLMPQSQLLLFFIIGWLIGKNILLGRIPTNSSVRNYSADLRIPGGKMQGLAQITLVIVIAAALWIQVREATEYYSFRKYHRLDWRVYYHPRYWQNGHRPAGGRTSCLKGFCFAQDVFAASPCNFCWSINGNASWSAGRNSCKTKSKCSVVAVYSS